MGNFSQVDAPESVTDRYTGGIKIFLESEEDVTIIGSKWFFAIQDQCSFLSADEGKADPGGGCQAVIDRVKEAREQGLDAYGIVDRDILLGNDPARERLRWELDDAVLDAARPFGDHIHILRRWEIENYLLHPEALARLVANRELTSRPPPKEEIAKALVEKEDDFIAVTLLSVMMVPRGRSQPKDGFAKHRNGRALQDEVTNIIECTEDEYHSHHRRVATFAEDRTDPISRWDRLTRMLDGKRVFHRLGHAIGAFKGVDMAAERGHLADIVRNLGLIDPEFEQFLARADVRF